MVSSEHLEEVHLVGGGSPQYPCEHTDTPENITVRKLRMQAVIILHYLNYTVYLDLIVLVYSVLGEIGAFPYSM